MSKFASRVVNRMLRTRNGTINGAPRIYNRDQDKDILGYVEINTQATSPVARIKTHKAWFAAGSEVAEGDLIEDRADNKVYLTMSLKNEIMGGETGYIDGTLYYANTTCSIERFTTGHRNAFGRPQDPSPLTIAANVYIMTTSMSLNVNEQKDQNLAQEKIKVVIQSKFGVEVNDRLVAANGDVYKVNSIDRTQLVGLWDLFVDKDIR